jgi:hypothetical protein
VKVCHCLIPDAGGSLQLLAVLLLAINPDLVGRLTIAGYLTVQRHFSAATTAHILTMMGLR